MNPNCIWEYQVIVADMRLEEWTGLVIGFFWGGVGAQRGISIMWRRVQTQLVMNIHFYNGFGSTGIKGALSLSLSRPPPSRFRVVEDMCMHFSFLMSQRGGGWRSFNWFRATWCSLLLLVRYYGVSRHVIYSKMINGMTYAEITQVSTINSTAFKTRPAAIVKWVENSLE